MPGPCNSKKKRKQQNVKEKQKSKRLSVSLSVQERDASPVDGQDEERARASGADVLREQNLDIVAMEEKHEEKETTLAQITDGHRMSRNASRCSSSIYPETNTSLLINHPNPPQPQPLSSSTHSSINAFAADNEPTLQPPVPSTGLENPFICDPGNGPRVKDAGAFLASFFCPPPSLEDETCASFSRAGVLHVLEAVLPKEIALVSVLFILIALSSLLFSLNDDFLM